MYRVQKEDQVVATPPAQRPAPKSADQQRSPGQTWHDGRYQDKPWAAKNKDGHIRRYKVQQNATQHAQSNTQQESSMPMGKPVSQMRRPAQDPRAGKFNDKMSVKSKTASDMVASRDVDTFDRGGEVGRPHMEGVNPVSVIARYATLGRALKTNESFSKVAQQIAQIAEMAEQTVMQEAGDWFDQHTIKRNMKEMKNYAGQFAKIAEELDTLQQRATALYDDMGNVLTRYFEINDADEGGEEGETPATSPERTEFDRGAADLGNSDQQGWTEDDKPKDEPTGGDWSDPWEEPSEYDEDASSSYPSGYFTHDEDDTEEDKEETEKMKDAARKAVANRFPKREGVRERELTPFEKKFGMSPAQAGIFASRADARREREQEKKAPKTVTEYGGLCDICRENPASGSDGLCWQCRDDIDNERLGRGKYASKKTAPKKIKKEDSTQDYLEKMRGDIEHNGMKKEATLPWATGEERKWSNAKLAKELRDAKDSLKSGQMNEPAAQKWLELLSREAQRRGVKEGRGFATPGSQDYKNNFNTQGLEGEARGDLANFGSKKQKPFSGRNQPTREERMIVAKEFAMNPAALNRVMNTFKKNEIKEMLKSGRAHNLKEARKMIAKEAISRFAVRAKKLLERGPVVKEAASPEQKIAQLKSIVDNHQATKVDGQLVDSFSASAILAVYRALNEENQAKFAALPVRQMAIVAFKLVK